MVVVVGERVANLVVAGVELLTQDSAQIATCSAFLRTSAPVKRPPAGMSLSLRAYPLLRRTIVASIVATCTRSAPCSAYASPRHTVSVRPARTTSPSATTLSPLAGANRL